MSDVVFVTVAQVGAIPEGTGRAYEVDGRMIAVFCDHGQYFAIDDLCPHMGASLAEGCLESGIVTCPWHAWRFRVSDGTWCDNPRIKIGQFPVRICGTDIQVGVIPRPSSAEQRAAPECDR
jgi:nitrite reductase (NADH) small subunit/3-phenylpropionate/trans-cinnamate dioxygenase ferredoxin subunit